MSREIPPRLEDLLKTGRGFFNLMPTKIYMCYDDLT